MQNVEIESYSQVAIPHLKTILDKNRGVLEGLSEQLISDVKANLKLLIFGSGHSALFPLELYHRAGGPSFVIPLIADYLLPSAGPPVVRIFERTAGSATPLLNRVEPCPGEMIWLASQSGINPAIVDLALESKRRGLRTVAFTSVTHSQQVDSRHPSKKKLFEVCDEVVDWGGFVGDASIQVSDSLYTGPLSTLSAVFLAHSILARTLSRLESAGVRCIYTSVNTPEGEHRNQEIEAQAKIRDPLLR